MVQQGSEGNELKPQDFEGLQPEKPLDSGDATGAPTPERYGRELAFQAWVYLEKHDPTYPLPAWVANYLENVAAKILGDLGPLGGLSPASAHAALGLAGKRWPLHHPESVFMIIQNWMDLHRKGGPIVGGRKAGAVKYIKEYMDNDRNVQPDTVIEWYPARVNGDDIEVKIGWKSGLSDLLQRIVEDKVAVRSRLRISRLDLAKGLTQYLPVSR